MPLKISHENKKYHAILFLDHEFTQAEYDNPHNQAALQQLINEGKYLKFILFNKKIYTIPTPGVKMRKSPMSGKKIKCPNCGRNLKSNCCANSGEPKIDMHGPKWPKKTRTTKHENKKLPKKHKRKK